MFSWLTSTLITVAIIIAVCLILIALIRYEHARPFLVGFLVLVWTFGGLYSGFTCYRYYTSQSKVIGEPEVFDPYENFNFFEYKLDSVTWYEENNSYYFKTTYATTMEFNGTENKYNMLINNKPCKTTNSTYGRVQGEYDLTFYDVDGNKLDDIILTTQLTFYTSKIDLRVDTNATAENIGMLKEYVNVNGFEIRLINQIYDGGAT